MEARTFLNVVFTDTQWVMFRAFDVIQMISAMECGIMYPYNDLWCFSRAVARTVIEKVVASDSSLIISGAMYKKRHRFDIDPHTTTVNIGVPDSIRPGHAGVQTFGSHTVETTSELTFDPFDPTVEGWPMEMARDFQTIEHLICFQCETP